MLGNESNAYGKRDIPARTSPADSCASLCESIPSSAKSSRSLARAALPSLALAWLSSGRTSLSEPYSTIETGAISRVSVQMRPAAWAAAACCRCVEARPSLLPSLSPGRIVPQCRGKIQRCSERSSPRAVGPRPHTLLRGSGEYSASTAGATNCAKVLMQAVCAQDRRGWSRVGIMCPERNRVPDVPESRLSSSGYGVCSPCLTVPYPQSENDSEYANWGKQFDRMARTDRGRPSWPTGSSCPASPPQP